MTHTNASQPPENIVNDTAFMIDVVYYKQQEVTMNNIDSIRNELDTLTKIIVDTVPVEQIYLFGSYAYGTPNNNSDIDLYLVFRDDMQMRELDALFAVQKAVYPVQKKAIDFLGYKKDKFISRSTGFSTIEKDISTKGIKLYG